MEPKIKKKRNRGKSESVFYEESIAKFGDVFSFGSNGIAFENWATRIGITCNICAEKRPDKCTWTHKTPTEHMSRGCINCRKEKAIGMPKERTEKQKANDIKKHENSIQNFIKNAPEKQGWRYDYTNESFKYELRKNFGDKLRGFVTVYCQIHNCKFSHWADDHLRGKTGCEGCTRDAKRVAMAKTWEQFIIDANAIEDHKGKYEYPLIATEYVNAKSKITIYCKTCKKNFSKIADDHLSNSRGCTPCSPNKSWGERTVYKFLDDNNIAFEDEFSFPGNRKRYDFLLTEYNIFIEYDGQQHFNFTKFWHIDDDGFANEQAKDVGKTVRALQDGYKMIRIDYLIATPADVANVINTAIERRDEYHIFVTSQLYDTMINSVKPLINADSVVIIMNEVDAI